MRRVFCFLAISLSTLACSAANGDLVFFNIDADPGGWSAAVAGLQTAGTYDFDLDADYGIAGFAGPLTSAGAGPVSAGILPDFMQISTDPTTDPTNNLVAVGPSGGFGNPSNSVLANTFADALQIDFTANDIVAYEFNALSLLGTGNVDFTATDGSGNEFFASFNVGAGTNIGILAINGQNISGVNFFDPGDPLGAEGIQGAGAIYRVPEPGSATLLGLAGFGMMMIRRRKAK